MAARATAHRGAATHPSSDGKIGPDAPARRPIANPHAAHDPVRRYVEPGGVGYTIGHAEVPVRPGYTSGKPVTRDGRSAAAESTWENRTWARFRYDRLHAGGHGRRVGRIRATPREKSFYADPGTAPRIEAHAYASA